MVTRPFCLRLYHQSLPALTLPSQLGTLIAHLVREKIFLQHQRAARSKPYIVAICSGWMEHFSERPFIWFLPWTMVLLTPFVNGRLNEIQYRLNFSICILSYHIRVWWFDHTIATIQVFSRNFHMVFPLCSLRGGVIFKAEQLIWCD